MSRTLARIRETTGDPIFVQAGRQLVPTPRALELRNQIKDAIQGAAGVLEPSAEVDLKLLDTRFHVRANDIFVAIYAGALLDAMQNDMPRATLCFTPEEDDVDDEALRTGRVDLFISASRELGHEIRVQPLFSTTMVGVAREGHPLFKDEITAKRVARWGHIGVSRRGKTQGPIDAALARLGLDRHVALVVPTPSSALLALQGSDLILPLPEQLARHALRMGMRVRLFELPLALSSVLITQAWHPRYQHEPAHQWLRRTIRRLTEDGREAAADTHASA
jgi:DNA-binding transcriptional LysR family regulator